MDYRFTILVVLSTIVLVSALPNNDSSRRISKRDVLETMKHAWNEVVKTFSNAGDAVVNVFKPTEKSIITKLEDALQPTEKSIVKKMVEFVNPTENNALKNVADQMSSYGGK